MPRQLAELEPSLLEDEGLADEGAEKIAWARSNMPVLAALHEELERERPLEGRRIGMCLHVEMKTAALASVLRAVGDGFMRATNSLIAAKTFAVVGYGSCGRSLARTLRALGAVVIVVERDEVRALEAAFDGMRVAGLTRAAQLADAVFTVTGRPG